MSFYPRDMPENGFTAWSAFEAATTYFAPSHNDFMFNLIVDRLDEALEHKLGRVVRKSLAKLKNTTTVDLAGSSIPMATRSSYGSRQVFRWIQAV